jgi:hypothetical protein
MLNRSEIRCCTKSEDKLLGYVARVFIIFVTKKQITFIVK